MKNDKGSAVVASIATIWVSTLLFTTTLGVIFSGYNLLLMREIAVSAAREGALAEKSAQQAEDYSLRMLRDSIPNLANYKVSARSNGNQISVEISSMLPGIGMLASFIDSRVIANATKESL